MNTRAATTWMLATVTTLIGAGGCRHCSRNSPQPSAMVPAAPVPAPACAGCAAPGPAFGAPPPGGISSGALPPVPATGGSFQAPPAPVPVSPDIRRYGPGTAADWTPSPNTQQGNVRLNVPQTTPPPAGPPPAARITPQPLPSGPSQAAVAEQPPAAPSALPVGIPQFATVKDGVSSGLKPLLDGLDWLQARGYRAVVNLRQPGEDDSADRRQVEKRGMKFYSLEVAPQTLTGGTLDEFNRIVADKGNQPLFVYDKEGALSGAMWYLYFRTHDRLPDAEAQSKATALGLRPDSASGHQPLWLAIQKVLSERTPQ